MKLENVTAEIRSRSKWESVDLGVALVQKNYFSLMLAWATLVVPFFLLILVLSYFWYSVEFLKYDKDTAWLYKFFYGAAPFLFIWWLKPIYERILLYVISRKLFGEDIEMAHLLTKFKDFFFKDFWRLMLRQRISMDRCFTLPIFELEGLRGKYFDRRNSLLSRNGGDGARSLTVSCILLTHLTMFTFYVTYIWLTMYGFQSAFISRQVLYFSEAFWGINMVPEAVPIMIFMLFNYMIVLSVFSPFYVGGGFALYINSRTMTEGWDVELAFKRMGSRLEKVRSGKSNSLFSLLVVLGVLFFTLSSQVVSADERIEAKAEIGEIMDTPEFDVTIQKFSKKIYKDKEGKSKSTDFSGLGFILKILAYFILAAMIGWMLYLLVKNAHIFHRVNIGTIKSREVGKVTKARSVLGMEITKESLPDDILSKARSAWLAGDKKLALSYLYRGSITWMVHTAELPVLESDTEHDCIKHIETLNRSEIERYFSFLTNAWIHFTYGKKPLEEDMINQLCDDWPFTDNSQTKSEEVMNG